MKPSHEGYGGIERLVHEENKSGPSETEDNYFDHGKKNRRNDAPDAQQLYERRGIDK
jgi:hypothetical protein